jgi:hypothetical protein
MSGKQIFQVLGAGLLYIFFVCHASHSLSRAVSQRLLEPLLSIEIDTLLALPLPPDDQLVGTGAGGNVYATFHSQKAPGFTFDAILGYMYLPVKAEMPLSLFPAGLGAGWRTFLTPRISLDARLLAGASLVILHEGPLNESSFIDYAPLLSVVGKVSFLSSPAASYGISIGYQGYLGLINTLTLSLGVSYHIQPIKKRPLLIEEAEFNPIFPVLYRQYPQRSPGHVVLENRGRFLLQEFQLSISVPSFSTGPIEWEIPDSLGPAQSLRIELPLGLDERALEIVQGEDATANLGVRYRYGQRQQEVVASIPLHFHDRNSIAWDDDRIAALFITEKDPVVLDFAGKTNALVSELDQASFDSNFSAAMSQFCALSALGLSYLADPRSPYSNKIGGKHFVDFLRFPRQTLADLSGDCDDLAVLYCALLEASGIETALITTPGHIFPAVRLKLTPLEAQKLLHSTQDLIELDGFLWLPVETTELRDGFLSAWHSGAELWRNHWPLNEAAFYKVHNAWDEYPPVNPPQTAVSSAYPLSGKVIEEIEDQRSRLFASEVEPVASLYLEMIEADPGNTKIRNRLGLLYARHGMYKSAEEQFLGLLNERSEYLPAVINLGNVYVFNGELEKALQLFKWANTLAPGEDRILYILSLVCTRLGKRLESQRYLKELQAINSDLSDLARSRSTPALTERGKDLTEEKLDVVLWLEE